MIPLHLCGNKEFLNILCSFAFVFTCVWLMGQQLSVLVSQSFVFFIKYKFCVLEFYAFIKYKFCILEFCVSIKYKFCVLEFCVSIKYKCCVLEFCVSIKYKFRFNVSSGSPSPLLANCRQKGSRHDPPLATSTRPCEVSCHKIQVKTTRKYNTTNLYHDH